MLSANPARTCFVACLLILASPANAYVPQCYTGGAQINSCAWWVDEVNSNYEDFIEIDLTQLTSGPVTSGTVFYNSRIIGDEMLADDFGIHWSGILRIEFIEPAGAVMAIFSSNPAIARVDTNNNPSASIGLGQPLFVGFRIGAVYLTPIEWLEIGSPGTQGILHNYAISIVPEPSISIAVLLGVLVLSLWCPSCCLGRSHPT
jgi:hypothetical protein